MPRGSFILVIRARAFFPIALAVPTRLTAKASASLKVFIKAPFPHFTSKTRASEPSATFFERILEVISGTDSTVAVTSRIAYRRRSAGTISFVCPVMAKPVFSIKFLNSASVKLVR